MPTNDDRFGRVECVHVCLPSRHLFDAPPFMSLILFIVVAVLLLLLTLVQYYSESIQTARRIFKSYELDCQWIWLEHSSQVIRIDFIQPISRVCFISIECRNRCGEKPSRFFHLNSDLFIKHRFVHVNRIKCEHFNNHIQFRYWNVLVSLKCLWLQSANGFHFELYSLVE